LSGFHSESFIDWMTIVSQGRNEASEKYDIGYLPASSALMSWLSGTLSTLTLMPTSCSSWLHRGLRVREDRRQVGDRDVEAVRVAGLGQHLLGLRGVVGVLESSEVSRRWSPC
jgi:hypothetical protein